MLQVFEFDRWSRAVGVLLTEVTVTFAVGSLCRWRCRNIANAFSLPLCMLQFSISREWGSLPLTLSPVSSRNVVLSHLHHRQLAALATTFFTKLQPFFPREREAVVGKKRVRKSESKKGERIFSFFFLAWRRPLLAFFFFICRSWFSFSRFPHLPTLCLHLSLMKWK